MSSENQRVGQRARRGVSWNLAGAVATNGIRIVVLAVLGRALNSRDFGIVAAAVSVNAILYSIRDIGLATALVQRETVDDAHLATGFAVSTYLGIAVSGLLVLFAPLIGRLYGIESSIDVLRVLAVLFTLRGISMTSRAICRRALNFRAVAIIDTASFLVGSLTSMGCAITGMGPWALVSGYLVEEIVSTVLYLRVAPPPRFTLRVDRRRLRELMTIGVGQTIAQITGILATFGDNFVVGRKLGAEALGYYTRAYDLIRLPSAVFATVLGNVLLPAYSRIQADRPRLAANFRRMTFANALVMLPASAALIVLAPEVIRLLMGPGWGEAVLPFRILTLTMLLRTTHKLAGIVATSAGYVNAIAIAFTLYMLQVIVGAIIAIPWGIVGVATSTALAITVSSLICAWIALRASSLRANELAAAHGPGLLLAILVGAATWPVAEFMRGAGVHFTIIFSGLALVSIALCIGVGAVWLYRERGDFSWLKGELKRLRARRR